MSLAENKKQVFSEVARAAQEAGREPDSVAVLAVTKYVDSATAKELVSTGVTHIAENRVDKFLDKYEALKDQNLTWHLIGTLQRRKVKDVINYVDYFHALDSVKLAQEIDKRADHVVNCFLQVNISGEESKHGFAPNDLPAILPELEQLERIRIVGLMTMAPIDADDAHLHALFEQTHQLQLELKEQKRSNMPFTELSLGMSRDFKIAIQHGSTFVRIGTAFFK